VEIHSGTAKSSRFPLSFLLFYSSSAKSQSFPEKTFFVLTNQEKKSKMPYLLAFPETMKAGGTDDGQILRFNQKQEVPQNRPQTFNVRKIIPFRMDFHFGTLCFRIKQI